LDAVFGTGRIVWIAKVCRLLAPRIKSQNKMPQSETFRWMEEPKPPPAQCPEHHIPSWPGYRVQYLATIGSQGILLRIIFRRVRRSETGQSYLAIGLLWKVEFNLDQRRRAADCVPCQLSASLRLCGERV